MLNFVNSLLILTWMRGCTKVQGSAKHSLVHRGSAKHSLVHRGGAEPVESADLTGSQRKSTENSNETVVGLFGIIKSSPSGIHSGAGGVIHNWFGFVLVRHLTCGSYFFSTGRWRFHI